MSDLFLDEGRLSSDEKVAETFGTAMLARWPRIGGRQAATWHMEGSRSVTVAVMERSAVAFVLLEIVGDGIGEWIRGEGTIIGRGREKRSTRRRHYSE